METVPVLIITANNNKKRTENSVVEAESSFVYTLNNNIKPNSEPTLFGLVKCFSCSRFFCLYLYYFEGNAKFMCIIGWLFNKWKLECNNN